MKKIMFIFVVVFLGFLVVNNKSYVKGNTQNNYPIGVNYFDIKDLVQNIGDQTALVSKAIKVKPEIEYTFVMGQNVLNEVCFREDEPAYIVYSDNNITKRLILDHRAPYEQDPITMQYSYMYYRTLVFTSNLITITELPVGNMKKNEIMLYEGSISLFTKFEPYVGDKGITTDIVIEASCEKLLSVNEIANHLKTYYLSNPISSTYKVARDEYTSHYTNIGVHNILYYIYTNLKTISFNVKVNVIDTVSPTIFGLDELTFMDTDIVDDNKILEQFVITDNYDENVDVIVEHVNTNKVKIKATDSSGNSTLKDVGISYISIPTNSLIIGPAVIHLTTADYPLTSMQILSLYSKNTSLGINIFSINNNFNNTTYGYNRNEGSYSYGIDVGYKSGVNNLYETYVVLIIVSDIKYPTVVVDNLTMQVSNKKSKSPEEIRDWIINNLKEKTVNLRNVNIEHNEYIGNEKKAGDYNVFYSYMDNNELKVAKATISVSGNSGNNIVTIIAVVSATVLIGGLATFFILKTGRKKRVIIKK
ncbi:MAG: hypothetical protein LBV51_05865 [Acholeplasmatales bacterium]|jgi:hypothetical protein|nr:hypothetical protein [Acholeplasmatales bacterium]